MTGVYRWNPLRELVAMQNAMNRAYNESYRDARPVETGHTLALDIYENDDAYTIIADIPGLSAEQISVNLHEGVLTISADIEQEEVDENTRLLACERIHGKFSRSIRLPQEIDLDTVAAEVANGTLTLVLSKTPEAKPRQIEVKSNGNVLTGKN